MLPATQYQLTNANDPDRKYTYSAKIVTAPPAGNTGWQVSIVGDDKCSPTDACKRLLAAMEEVKKVIEASTTTKPATPKAIERAENALTHELEDAVDKMEPGKSDEPADPETVVEDEPEPAPAPEPPASTASSIGGIVVEMREAGKEAGGVPRPPGWPTGPTF